MTNTEHDTNGLITCERCGRSTTDPDLWDPEVDTGRIFCNRCWDHRDEPTTKEPWPFEKDGDRYEPAEESEDVQDGDEA